MRWWPFESRSRGDYTDQRVTAGRRRVEVGKQKTEELAAVEACAGLAERTLMGLETSLEPDILGWIGRSLILRGEAILFEGMPVADHEITGGWRPEEWVYRLDLQGPTKQRTEYRHNVDLVHLRMNVDPRRPWCGRPAWRTAKLTSNAAVAMEHGVRQLMDIPPFTVLPIDARLKSVSGLTMEQWSDLADQRRRDLEESNLVLQPVESGSAGGLGGTVNAPGPAAGSVSMRSELRADLVQACGVPAVIFDPRVTGPSLREGFRSFEHTWIMPVCSMIKAEFARVGQPVEIGLSGRFGGELQAKARAMKTLTDAGVGVDQAREICGL